MVDELTSLTPDAERITPVQFAVRAFWIAVQLVVVIYLGQPGALFFYQMF